MAKLYFYHSVMNSGKSAHIIMQVHNLRHQGKTVFVLKPQLDTRDFGIIKSRALETELPAYLIKDDFDVFEYVKNIGMVDYVFVDEVNFLNKRQIENLSEIADRLNIPVFGYGLLTDYKTQLFEGSKRMIELADSVRELSSPCVICSKKATMHLRKINNQYIFDGDSILVGDTDEYESVCRTCYKKVEITSF